MIRWPMPQRLFVVCTVLGATAGAIFGFVRGLDYVPTLPFAVIEGGVLIGIPSALLGAVLGVSCWIAQVVQRRHQSADPTR